jgi:hypothetical protein
MSPSSRPFDPETLAVLKAVFEQACELLPPHQRTQEMLSALADLILGRAAGGERNPAQLRTYAFMEVAGRHRS